MTALLRLPAETPLTLVYAKADRMSDDEYVAFCLDNPDLQLERSPEGQIIIVPPAGALSDYRNGEVFFQLKRYTKSPKAARGEAFGPSVQFFLPDGSALSPDAAWVRKSRLALVSEKERKGFPYLVPDFIVEVLSPSDRLSRAKTKMQRWTSNGAKLAWLIDADKKTVHVYRPGKDPIVQTGLTELSASPTVPGFKLNLSDVWKSY